MPGQALFVHLAAALLSPPLHSAQVGVVPLQSDTEARIQSQDRASDPVTPILEPTEPPEGPAGSGSDPLIDGQNPPSDRPNAPPTAEPPGPEVSDPASPPEATALPALNGALSARRQLRAGVPTRSETVLLGPARKNAALQGAPHDTTRPTATNDSNGVHLSLEADGGVSLRLDKEPRGFDTEEPLDLTFGAGVWLSPTRRYALAVAYRSMGLGGARSAQGSEDVSVQRDLDTLWLGGRVYPVLGTQLGLFLQLEVGGTWQRMATHGTEEGLPFSCTAREGPRLMLGGGAGVDVILDDAISFIAVVDATAHRLSHDVVDECAPGSGAVANATGQVGFVYHIDLGGEPAG
ncbi:MAG: hypothetical protein JW940_31565 [Polyangiaceae bacterium]|nr:hypothetical protein [Polyangiaceae bacterium]